MSAKKYRYPGVQPFKTEDKDVFFGRNDDREKLYALIQEEKMVVLFGRSGYGKSSLLNAGIAPLLADPHKEDDFNYTPVEVRFGNYPAADARTPLQTLLIRIGEKCAPDALLGFLEQTEEKDTLWGQFKIRQAPDPQRFVLIFDQFEEIFSYPVDQQQAFSWQLADLLFTDIPQSIRDRMKDLSGGQIRRLAKPLNVKAVFSVRSDRLSRLDRLKEALPSILQKRYELRSLTPAQAREAVELPARSPDPSFASPPFDFLPDALTHIVKELKSTQTGGVEAFQLQIVCEEIEKAVEDGRIPDRTGNGIPDVGLENLPDFNNLYENYYRRKLNGLPEAVRPAAQRVLEDGLLAEDPATGESRRMSVDVQSLLKDFSPMGLTEEALKELEETYLIRREANTVGGYNLEISHDTLAVPIQKAKKERRALEIEQKMEREQAEKEYQLQEARRQAGVEKRRGLQSRMLALAAIIGLGFSIWQSRISNNALENMAEANLKVVDGYLKTVDEHILKLEYEEALEDCQASASLNVASKKEEINKRLLELAYFFTEMDNYYLADKGLSSIDPGERVSTSLPGVQNHLQARIAKLCPSGYFDTLKERYYPKMIEVAGGEFEMGGDIINEQRVHTVNLKKFKIAETETTVWQYFLFIRATKKFEKANSFNKQMEGNTPIMNITWLDAKDYLGWLSKRSGGDTLRFPTEAEWEYAARGGAAGKDSNYLYSGSQDVNKVGWYDKNSNNHTHAVKTKAPNALGLYDMSGNVYEWCADYYHPNYLGAPADGSAWLVGDERFRVIRGGAWEDPSSACLVSSRFKTVKDAIDDIWGFRAAQGK